MAITRVLAALAMIAVLWMAPANADDARFNQALAGLAADGFAAKAAAVETLAATGDPRALEILRAMGQGSLYLRKDDGKPVLGVAEGREVAIRDPMNGAPLGTVASRELARITLNNALRTALSAAIGRFELSSPEPARRISAAEGMIRDPSPDAVERLTAALAKETDAGAKAAIGGALARLSLASPDPARRLAAVEALAEAGDLAPEIRAVLQPLTRRGADGGFLEPDIEVRRAATQLIARIDQRLLLVEIALNLFQGVSLGSVLLLAAVGLAITFGVMGVINMAHGEMIMLGAYATFVVQEAFRAHVPPAYAGAYLLVAIPVAFLVAGGIGVALERAIIRFLYGRPLETLLATWGISLMLQQLVRSVFGAPNKEVANPAWMTGAWEALPGLVLTWNRIAIIVFALAVLGGVAALLRFTSFGLQMRAVTQNRPMAAAMGIRTARVDALTFGLGSGIAGVAGVALSQIGNVSPNLGQNYIVDSFMVVVFGGVGSLWGVLAGALSLGVVNKVLEPTAGAMLGKILVLVFIILFIQKRPRGLFALKGRAAEA